MLPCTFGVGGGGGACGAEGSGALGMIFGPESPAPPAGEILAPHSSQKVLPSGILAPQLSQNIGTPFYAINITVTIANPRAMPPRRLVIFPSWEVLIPSIFFAVKDWAML